ncbi:type IIL restriction-modification enzyme MmeI [Dolosigranulum pigrum]|uniref:type IIL restriction-modification enzyme MmeI n=1 Tax=Dolosigranulum pigrum TaxID=29394 RepID=UPI003525F3EB
MRLNQTGTEIIRSRDLYSDWLYADLYNELTMPPKLRKAHQENAKAIMNVYGFNW